jgi:hypothetical protein
MTGEVDAALTKALPGVLREVRQAVGERRGTMSSTAVAGAPKLFATMIKDGFDVQTYPSFGRSWAGVAGFKIAHANSESSRAARARGAAVRAAPQRSSVRRGARPHRASRGQARHATQRPGRYHQDDCLSGRQRSACDAASSLRPRRSRGRTLPHELLRQVTSAFLTASCKSHWPRSARLIERMPAKPRAGSSTRRQRPSPALVCAFVLRVRPPPRNGHALPASREERNTARPPPRRFDRRPKPDALALPMSGALNLGTALFGYGVSPRSPSVSLGFVRIAAVEAPRGADPAV